MEFPATYPVWLMDRLDVARLVAYLRQGTRVRPVTVLSTAKGQSEPYVPAGDVLSAGGGEIDVVVIPTGELTFGFADALDDSRAAVYGGACRVYPPGTRWESDPQSAPLRMARDCDEVAALPGLLFADVRRAVAQVRSGQAATAPQPMTRPTADVGAGVVGLTPAVPAGTAEGGRVIRPKGSIASADDAEELARYLRSADRMLPAAVVSRASGESEAYVNVARLRSDLAGLADVFEIVTLDASWAFTRAVPDKCQVYGGAGRVYPVGTAWETDPYAARLRFAYGRVDREHATRMLIADAMTMPSRGTHTVESAGLSARPVTSRVVGEVEGVVGNRAVVNLRGQTPGVVWPELIEPGVPAERLFGKHMRVEGELDPESRRIDVREMRRNPEDAVSAYQPGETVLLRVTGVSSRSCVTEPFPGVRCRIEAQDMIDEPADLRELIAVGDVLPALLVGRDESTGEWLLSPQDADDAGDAVPAPSILVGGPPWLVPADTAASEHHVPEPDDAEAPDDRLAEQQPSSMLVKALRQEKDQLVDELRRTRAEVEELKGELDDTRRRLRDVIRRKQKARMAGADDSHLFADEQEQFDFEVRLAWARTVSAEEKEPVAAQAPDVRPRLLPDPRGYPGRLTREGRRGRRPCADRARLRAGLARTASAALGKGRGRSARRPRRWRDMLAGEPAVEHPGCPKAALLVVRGRLDRAQQRPDTRRLPALSSPVLELVERTCTSTGSGSVVGPFDRLRERSSVGPFDRLRERSPVGPFDRLREHASGCSWTSTYLNPHGRDREGRCGRRGGIRGRRCPRVPVSGRSSSS